MKRINCSYLFFLSLCLFNALCFAEELPFKVSNDLKLSGRIAFSAKIDSYESIYLLDLDNKQVRTLISGPYNNSYPTWSADGEKLAFSSSRDGNIEIYSSDWEGLNQTRLTKNSFDDGNPAWSPDGKSVVFYSDKGKSKNSDAQLAVLNLTTGQTNTISGMRGRNTTPKFSADGKRIAYSTNRFWPGWDVCIWNQDLAGEECPLQGVQTFCRPDWSAAGQLLAYSTGAANQIDLAYLDLQNGKSSSLTSLPGKEYDASWSSDGKFIAFTAEEGRDEVFNLLVVERETRKVSPLVRSEYSIRFLSWSPITTLQLEAKRIKEHESSLPTPAPTSTATPIPTSTLIPSSTPTPSAVPTPTEIPFDENSTY